MQTNPGTSEDRWGHETGTSVDTVALHPSPVRMISAYTTTDVERAHPHTSLQAGLLPPHASPSCILVLPP